MQADFFEAFGGSGTAVLAVVLVVYGVLLLAGLLTYILQSLSLFTIAKRRGIPNYGLAWVPVAHLWTLGSIADGYDATHGVRRKWRHVLLWLAVAMTVVVLAFYFAILFGAIVSAVSAAGNGAGMREAELFRWLLWLYAIILPLALLQTAYTACHWICFYKLFESCAPQKAVLLLLLSLLVPFAFPFCMLFCRNRDLGMPAAPDGAPVQRLEAAPDAPTQTL